MVAQKLVYQRNSRGVSFIALTTILSFFVLLPLALISFEIGRIQLSESQLKVATDTAALAGAIAIDTSSSTDPATLLTTGQNAGLLFFQRQVVTSISLSNATVSPSVATDSPAYAHSEFYLTYDSGTGLVTARGALGINPAFGNFLGLSTMPLHATSKANAAGGQQTDLVLVFDRSTSMTPVLSSALIDTENFISQVHAANPGVNFSLVALGASPTCPVANPSTDPRTQVLVPLSTTSDNYDSVETALAGITLSDGTWTGGALGLGVGQVTGTGHRAGAKQVIVLVTDGLADLDNPSGPSSPAACYPPPAPQPPESSSTDPTAPQEAYTQAGTMKANSITLIGIGYFHSYAGTQLSWGEEFISQLVSDAGGTNSYTGESDADLVNAFNSTAGVIGAGGTPGLVN